MWGGGRDQAGGWRGGERCRARDGATGGQLINCK